jgi:hypothetical protein
LSHNSSPIFCLVISEIWSHSLPRLTWTKILLF